MRTRSADEWRDLLIAMIYGSYLRLGADEVVAILKVWQKLCVRYDREAREGHGPPRDQ